MAFISNLIRNRRKQAYQGKSFSILGDSISTLEGFNPPGFHVFYEGLNKKRTGVCSMADTWWGQVISSFHGQLLVNNSWSGSRVTKLPDQCEEFPSGCSEKRTKGLHIEGQKPDVILIYLGTNDWAYGVPPTSTSQADRDGLENMCVFSCAYGRMLDSLKTNYPGADIWCCTLCESYMSANQTFAFPHSYAGIHIEQFNKVIREYSAAKKCRLIDLYRCHAPYDSIDGSHPTKSGMNTLAIMVYQCICEEMNWRC